MEMQFCPGFSWWVGTWVSELRVYRGLDPATRYIFHEYMRPLLGEYGDEKTELGHKAVIGGANMSKHRIFRYHIECYC